MLLGIVGFYTVSGLHQAYGQQVLQPTAPPQNQIYQNQIYQSPIYQGPVYQAPSSYPNQGRIFQPQPLPAGPVYRAPAGSIQTVPPVARRVPQSDQSGTQQALGAERAAYNAEKLALVEKLLEKYKATAAENQGAVEQLESVKQKNVELLKRMDELDQASKSYQTKVLTLEEKLAAVGQTNPAVMQEAAELKIKYRQAVDQVKDLELKVQTLSGQREDYLDEITNLKAAQENAMNSQTAGNNQAELAEKNQQLTTDKQALEQEKLQFNQEYTTLKEQYQNLSQQQQLAKDENRKLSDRIIELSSRINEGQISEVAAINAGTSEPSPISDMAQPSIDVSSYETKISQLTRKNRQLSESNSEFKGENQSLSRQLSSLKNQSGQETVADESSAIVSTSLPASLPAAAATVAGKEGGWGILTWLIPFLAIGLGVALFVILKEELHRGPAGDTDRSNRQA